MTDHPYRITDQDVTDVFTTALEGGITYWASKAEVPEWPSGCEFASDVPAAGGNVILHYDDPDEDEGNAAGRFTLNKGSIRASIRKACALRGLTPRRFIDNHDAGDADLAIQFMVFGEIVYG